jgi:hypothetical protein
MKNYLEQYVKAPVTKHQMGGEVPAGAPAAPAEGGSGGGDMASMLEQFAQTQDPQLAVQIANMLLEQLGAQGGGGAPEGQPMPAQGYGGRVAMNKPMFRKGGRLAV